MGTRTLHRPWVRCKGEFFIEFIVDRKSTEQEAENMRKSYMPLPQESLMTAIVGNADLWQRRLGRHPNDTVLEAVRKIERPEFDYCDIFSPHVIRITNKGTLAAHPKVANHMETEREEFVHTDKIGPTKPQSITRVRYVYQS